MGDVAGTFPVGLDPIAFGGLTAKLDDPFAERAEILATAGLDEATYAELRERWSRAVAGLDEPRLRAFGDAYAAEREALAHARRAPAARAVALDPRFLNADVQAFREQAAAVTLSAAADASALHVNPEPPPPAPVPAIARPPQELASTADITAFVPHPATPFVPGLVPEPPPPAPAPVIARPPQELASTADITAFVPRPATPFMPGLIPAPPPPAPAPAIVRPPHELASTADISAFVPRPATPFVPAPATPPRRRLVRFDPQTGQPLAEPRWEDLPEPEPPKR